MDDKEVITSWFTQLQDDICAQLEAVDGARFQEDIWKRPGGGGGRTRVIEGRIIEKGGVNFSAVHGALPANIAHALGVAQGGFHAAGVSIVLHPLNPWAPIIHMNVRYFELDDGQWWFGGGIDLTPHYVDLDEARYFHRQLRAVCERFHPDYYPRFKQWADEYFYLRHRGETRGVGGIFFDRLNEDGDFSRSERFAFVRAVGECFTPLYTHLLREKAGRPYDEIERHWQYLRRGRYVEFNLVWDKGTKFGLDTDGRTESILMSLPPIARWVYDHQPEPGSREADTLAWLRKDVDWLSVVGVKT
jgi:coproporphyrinogen III oxidase